ncbi:MAG TPA: FKBP-type peptidyl-prolyl cis-trans isomerase [Pirellulales bacterium]|nr:FKBP-type peptidyl-prolyl cis-trans isomerase [Pirellulales bacterium]
MRTTLFATLAMASLGTAALAQQPAPGAADFKDPKAKYSYALGFDMARNTKDNVDFEAFVRGIRDGIAGKGALSDQEIEQARQMFQQVMIAEEQKAMQAMGQKSKQEGDAFLAANKAKPGVVTLPDGLQYKVIKQGNGPTPKATDTVTVHYTGTLTDGTKFDSSVDRGQPASFPVNRVIKGWVEALQLMKVGDKWQLFIPSNLAYGEQGSPPAIPPNAVLVFDVELLGIQ